MRWLPSSRRILRSLQKTWWIIKTRMNFWLLSRICRSTTVLDETHSADGDALAAGFHPNRCPFSGSVRQQDKTMSKVSVIGGGDLGMASVMSILSKVTPPPFTFKLSGLASVVTTTLHSRVGFSFITQFFLLFPSVGWISWSSSTWLRVPPKAAPQTWRFSACPTWRYPEVRPILHRHTSAQRHATGLSHRCCQVKCEPTGSVAQ